MFRTYDLKSAILIASDLIQAPVVRNHAGEVIPYTPDDLLHLVRLCFGPDKPHIVRIRLLRPICGQLAPDRAQQTADGAHRQFVKQDVIGHDSAGFLDAGNSILPVWI